MQKAQIGFKDYVNLLQRIEEMLEYCEKANGCGKSKAHKTSSLTKTASRRRLSRGVRVGVPSLA
jgi:hypothetical protein